MDNVLVDRSAGGQNLRRRAAGAGCRRLAMSSPALPPSAYTFFPFSPVPPPAPFIYAPYNFYSSNSLPLLSSNHPGLPPRPPVTIHKQAMFPYRTSTLPPRPASVINHTPPTEMVTVVPRKTGEYKRKKPRTPRSAEEPPRAAQRRKPLQRAAPLPTATAVTEALDDLERQVTRGFVEDLLHALAPPPSSLPLPTFSLVRAAAAKAPPPCTV
ncbi:amyloid beta A4 precursor protein-binding family B member 1-interacting protein-like [Lolium rigidum]|uniref:amyloid beta A4 precursor protein-binding family B member 1-interacting protein-like n=1 Tax=Lolium rigidum TaxID=89674 RepID=UPI001F5DEC62|nr:amyloid beta A4 precursor protein-binding family B member 1-interacting protein-like [Lolium rigidum]